MLIYPSRRLLALLTVTREEIGDRRVLGFKLLVQQTTWVNYPVVNAMLGGCSQRIINMQPRHPR
jgi:hypothetical protein